MVKSLNKDFFTSKMFYILLFPLLLFILFLILSMIFSNSPIIGTYGLNKTVGWAWDITNTTILIYPLYLFYLLGYGIITLLKYKTNYIISIAHLISILICIIPLGNPIFEIIKLFSILLGLILFFVNIILAFKTNKTIHS